MGTSLKIEIAKKGVLLAKCYLHKAKHAKVLCWRYVETLDLFDSEGKCGIQIDSPVFTSVSEYPVLGVHDIFDIF